MDIRHHIKQADEAFTSVERTNNESFWDEASEFMLNNQHTQFRDATATQIDISNEISTSKGSKKTRRLFDSTALQATQDLASAFQGTLTNPATIWSRLRFQEDDLNNNQEAIAWLDDVNQLLHNKMNESNFNTEMAKAYQSFVALSNMAIFLEEGDNGNFRFTSVHIGQIAWSENKNGLVDTVYRRFTMTARQAMEKWGNKVHPEIIKNVEKNPDKEFNFLHVIKPRDKNKIQEAPAPAEKRAVASIYIDTSHNELIEESGYYEMPIFVARWSLMPGERYGRGPSNLALPDVRTLNKVKELSLRSVAKSIDPPLLANQRSIFGTIDIRPSSISIVKDTSGITPIPNTARHDVVQFTIEELKASIKGIFFLDKLLLPPRTETGEMTAFEVSQRIEQMQRVLGPTLSRLNNEVLNPLVVREFKMLLRSGQLPEAPAILQERGINVEIVFVNQLARAQQIQDVNTIQQWVQGLAAIAQLDPTVIDNINVDGIAKHTAKTLGVPEEAIQNDKAIQQIREQRAQAQQAAEALEAGIKAADINSKLQT